MAMFRIKMLYNGNYSVRDLQCDTRIGC